jgi:hypothetical protein
MHLFLFLRRNIKMAFSEDRQPSGLAATGSLKMLLARHFEQ